MKNFFMQKKLSITKNIEENVMLTMNETLAEILIINLLTNAIKHNVEGGSITIELTKNIYQFQIPVKFYMQILLFILKDLKKNLLQTIPWVLVYLLLKKYVKFIVLNVIYNYENMMHTVTVNFFKYSYSYLLLQILYKMFSTFVQLLFCNH